MDELKLLVLNKVTLTREFNKISHLELRWFQLRNCQRADPICLKLDKVAVLDFEGSKLTSLSCGDHILQVKSNIIILSSRLHICLHCKEFQMYQFQYFANNSMNIYRNKALATWLGDCQLDAVGGTTLATGGGCWQLPAPNHTF